ncbi:MAG: ATP-binding region ATPase domain protein, partial [Cyanobacteria bacterium RYN_339]|nr:ATP-binding region ATPase domain protein [Cyanobacteria bacterium RYN_339]
AKERAPVYLAYREARVVETRGPLRDERFAYFNGEFADRGFDFLYIVPVQLDEGPLGVLAFYFEHEAQVRSADLVAVQLVATTVAATVTVNAYRRHLAARIVELEELNTVLQQQVLDLDRVSRTKTDMLGIVNHELRTPLTAIIGYAEILRKRASRDEDRTTEEFLTYIFQSAKRLQAITEDAMTASLIENGMFSLSPEECNMNDLLRTVIGAFGPRLGEREMGIRELGLETPVVAICDPKRVAQVLTNVIGNALKFSPRGTVVDVELASTDATVSFTVRDQGPGIPPEQLERVFEKYYQVNSSSGRRQDGMGLGLMIARSIMQAHGGAILVRNGPDRGTEFEITFPRTSCESGDYSYALDP